MTTAKKLPTRLHHTAYVTKDLEATRAFYEDVIGLPLVATWCEQEELFGEERTFAHCFFEMADGSALAFFQFANQKDHDLFGPEQPESPFIHIALNVDEETQAGIIERIDKAGITEPDTYILDHGYCKSVYVKDPNRMLLEFTTDAVGADGLKEIRRASAREDLKRWLGGDHTPNNDVR
ncbi:VOC family protein [Kordiimonas sp.]|uniref:VOC family protein n=1 Tax=Kordiimonas sp. TaxID=1970157 RepID=UPI003A9560AA